MSGFISSFFFSCQGTAPYGALLKPLMSSKFRWSVKTKQNSECRCIDWSRSTCNLKRLSSFPFFFFLFFFPCQWWASWREKEAGILFVCQPLTASLARVPGSKNPWHSIRNIPTAPKSPSGRQKKKKKAHFSIDWFSRRPTFQWFSCSYRGSSLFYSIPPVLLWLSVGLVVVDCFFINGNMQCYQPLFFRRRKNPTARRSNPNALAIASCRMASMINTGNQSINQSIKPFDWYLVVIFFKLILMRRCPGNPRKSWQHQRPTNRTHKLVFLLFFFLLGIFTAAQWTRCGNAACCSGSNSYLRYDRFKQ